MRHSIGVSGVFLALVMVACGGGAEDESAQLAQETLSEPACEPSERMDVVGRTSPYDSTSLQVGEGVAKVCYGRPSLRGRTMIGGEAVPYDTLWRTGANEPTILHLNVPAEVAGVELEPGAYSLYSVPREGEEWTLILNRSTSQWGHESNYTEEVRAQEVERVQVPAETIEDRVEQFTIRPMDSNGFVLEWQNSRVRIPISPAG